MYSEQDVRDAVAAGAISHEAAEGLRRYVAGARVAPATDEETFRLLNSFNDIFVTIAAVLLLVAMGGIGAAIAPGAGGLLVAAAAWGMAEYFTRLRRMALPSIVLLLAFVGGVVAGPADLLNAMPLEQLNDRLAVLVYSGVFVLGAVAAWFHWRRFKVPITVAAGTGAVAATVIALVLAAIGPENGHNAQTLILPLVFAAGLAVFAYAMRWDMSDRGRETRRSDVAFWLHLLAAPMIAHPLFQWLGISSGDAIGASGAVLVLAIYVLFGIVALAVDRRALLVSALAYVLFALTRLFQEFGMVELNVALTALVIGSALLSLSAFWTRIRSGLVRQLPGGWQARLPVAGAMATA
jgi:MFS family permease